MEKSPNSFRQLLNPGERNKGLRVFKSVWRWFDDRTGTSNLFGPLLKHKVPDARGFVGWSYILGSLTLVAFVVQVATGIALSTSYVTSTGQAYDSLKFITEQAPFGNTLRALHNWGASAMVLFIGLHAVQVFLVGAFKYPREANWLSGVFLLLLTLGMGFTGQLLRWDQTAVWSVVVAASQAGRTPLVGGSLAQFILAGNTVGGATLSRFFAFHVFFIPAIVFGLIGLHLYLVIRNGVSDPPKVGDSVEPKTERQRYHAVLDKTGVPFWPDAVWRDAVGAVVLIAVIFALAIFVGPPELGKPPDPSILQAYPRPDWYLLWYFSALALIPSNLETVVIIGGPLAVGVILVALPFIAKKGERNPLRRPWAVGFVLLIVIMIGTLWISGINSDWSPKIDAQPLPPSVVGATSGQVAEGGKLFYEKGCLYCHNIGGYGGARGPNLNAIANRYTEPQLISRILNGGNNMPAYGSNLEPQELNSLVAFLKTRKDAKEGGLLSYSGQISPI